MSAAQATDHAALMDSIYSGQRHVYDLTRKYYLFGRDKLIADLDAGPESTVLEIACGTGRNLAAIQRRWPGTRLHGLDISAEMLKSARSRLPGNVALQRADAGDFDAMELFGRDRFDRVVLSYSLSMIPDWEAALRQASGLLAPHGSLHVVDFGTLASMPAPIAAALRHWLARFHVCPRVEMEEAVRQIASTIGLECEAEHGPWSYYQRFAMRRTGA